MTEMLRALRDGWEKTWPDVHCALHGGLPAFVLAPDPQDIGAGVPVFCYHAPEPATLEADLAFLRRNDYVTITADALADHMEGVSPAPPRAVVLTFDDGLPNLFDVVYPRLRAHGFSAVAFISPWFHDRAQTSGGVCTWSEIVRMHESGCLDFQSHTYQHRYVPRWPEPLALEGISGFARELSEAARSMTGDFRLARTVLERRLRKSVRHLAFPRYRGTEEAVKAAVATGHRALWWGTLPGRPLNRSGDPVTHVARMSGELLRRLPGEGRMPLPHLVRRRCSIQLQSLRRRFAGRTACREVHA